jgi:RNA polymerase sigma-70 factor (ECF subfamily)
MNGSRRLDVERAGDHLDRLYRAAWAFCGSREEAEDLVQETYVRILAKPRFLRNEDDLGYMLRVLRNTFLSERRTRRRRPQLEPFPEWIDPPDHSSAAQPEEATEARLVYAAIAALPEEFRAVLVAVDIAGLSYAEAARALSLPAGTVTSRLFRARREVSRSLEGEQQSAPRARESVGTKRPRTTST